MYFGMSAGGVGSVVSSAGIREGSHARNLVLTNEKRLSSVILLVLLVR